MKKVEMFWTWLWWQCEASCKTTDEAEQMEKKNQINLVMGREEEKTGGDIDH